MKKTAFCALFAATALLASRVNAQDLGTARYQLKLLPFTGLVVPHQQVSEYNPSAPLGVGFEVLYSPRVALSLDTSVSWHGGGPSGRDDLRLLGLHLAGRYRFPDRHFNPFLEIGVGGYQATPDGSDGKRELGGAGVLLGAGAEVDWSERFALQLEARTHVVHGSDDGADAEGWIGHSQLLAWLIYRLP